MVHDAGDMARAGEHERCVPAIEFGGAEHALVRDDMIILGGLQHHGDLDVPHVHLLSEDGVFALGEAVLGIAFLEIAPVDGTGNVGLVRVPVEQVERAGRLAQHVGVNDIAPDEIDRAQPVEGFVHVLAGHDAAMLVDQAVDIVPARTIGEHLEIAGKFEIRLRGEEGGGGDLVIAGGRHVGEGRREQRAADAITDAVDLLGAGGLQRAFDGGVDALLHIVVPVIVHRDLVGRAPGDDEDREAPVNQPADHRVFLPQVEHVELVDPGREDHQRLRIGLGLRRGVLDEFDQVVAEDDFAGGGRNVHADFERGFVRLRDVELAAALADIIARHAQASEHAFAAAFDEGTQGLRVGAKEVGGR